MDDEEKGFLNQHVSNQVLEQQENYHISVVANHYGSSSWCWNRRNLASNTHLKNKIQQLKDTQLEKYIENRISLYYYQNNQIDFLLQDISSFDRPIPTMYGP